MVSFFDRSCTIHHYRETQLWFDQPLLSSVVAFVEYCKVKVSLFLQLVYSNTVNWMRAYDCRVASDALCPHYPSNSLLLCASQATELSTRAIFFFIGTGVRQECQPKRCANYYLSKKL